MVGRFIIVVALIPYVLWLIFGYRYHLVDGVNLGAHEAGHMLFRFLGQTLHILGGSLGQLVFPIAVVVHFARRGQRFEAAVCTVWIAESLMYMAEYLGDARAQVLPLVGGHIHDWHWLLSRAGLLEHCELIAAALHGFAGIVAVTAVGIAGHAAWSRRHERAEHEIEELDWDRPPTP